MLDHLRTLYGSDELSDLVVVLSTQREASASSAAAASGGPSKKRGRVGRAKAVPKQQEAHEAAGTRISAHSVVVCLSPVWRAELVGAGFKPATTEAAGRKVRAWMRTRQGRGRVSPDARRPAACAAADASTPMQLLVVRVEEEEVGAAEALLRFMYTGELAATDAGSLEQLMRTFRLADRFQVRVL